MENLKYAHMMHWKQIKYKKINNMPKYYYRECNNNSYYADWDKIIKYHVACGFTGIELMPYTFKQMVPLFGTTQNFLDFIHERGMEQVTGTFFGAGRSFDKTAHPDIIQTAQNLINSAAELGCLYINVCPAPNYCSVGALDMEQMNNIAAVMNEIGKRAQDKGITICHHNEFFCAVNRDTQEILLEKTNPEYVSYCLDTAQVALMGKDPVAFYDTYHERIASFHLKDTQDYNVPDEIRYGRDPEIQDNGYRWFWEPGEGIIDFPALYEKMKQHEYKGWVAVELDGTPDLLASMLETKWYIDNVLSPIYK